MDLDFSEEQEVLREMVRGLCAEFAPLDVVREMEDDPTGYPAELWKRLARAGPARASRFPEAYGGGGSSRCSRPPSSTRSSGVRWRRPAHFASCRDGRRRAARGGQRGAEARVAAEDRVRRGDPDARLARARAAATVPRGVQLAPTPDGDELRGSPAPSATFSSPAPATRLLVLARTGEGEVDLFLVDPRSPRGSS